MSQSSFQTHPDVYDALVDWSARLANESPFYRTVFERAQVHAVLDAACGTGRHAAMFRDWGLLVEGADQSPEMIAAACEKYGDSDELRWVRRSFDEPPPAGTFDAAICVGNSLALATDLAMVGRTVRALMTAVKGGGVVVLHVLNLWRLPDGPVVWQKFRRMTLGGTVHLLVKGVHRAGERGFIDLLDFRDADATPSVKQVTFLGLRHADLEHLARDAGAASVDAYGDYSFSRYDEAGSTDLIVVIRTRENNGRC